MTYFGIDIGVNLSNPAFQDDLEQVLERGYNNGVKSIIATGTSIDSTINNSGLNKKDIHFTAGIHPHASRAWCMESLERKFQFLKCLYHCVAIGETGLDFYRLYSSKEEQRHLFELHIIWSLHLSKPLFIHDRDSNGECYDMLKTYNFPAGVVHCFDGDYEIGKKYIDAGYYLGISGGITRNNFDWLGKFPLDRLMVETDAPYLYPKNSLRKLPFKKTSSGWRSEPAHLKDVLEYLHKFYKSYDIYEFCNLIEKNTNTFFKLKEYYEN